jgi:hypothetical protein
VLEPLVNPLLARLIVALISDLRGRRIPNILVLAGLVKCEPVHKKGKHFGLVQEIPLAHQKNPNAIADSYL